VPSAFHFIPGVFLHFFNQEVGKPPKQNKTKQLSKRLHLQGMKVAGEGISEHKTFSQAVDR
jgi:hypothetical protein